jgi:hypothetical protein
MLVNFICFFRQQNYLIAYVNLSELFKEGKHCQFQFLASTSNLQSTIGQVH